MRMASMYYTVSGVAHEAESISSMGVRASRAPLAGVQFKCNCMPTARPFDADRGGP